MKRFLIVVGSVIIAPVAILLIVYLVTDPFKTLKSFSLEYFDTTNRDYLSSELYLLNSKTITYDSFIFGSSRCCGINSYHWKHYLPEGSNQFVFQAWSETLTGIYQKVTYLDRTGTPIRNALIVLDIPGSFAEQQLPTSALAMKDWRISGQSQFVYQIRLFNNFLQKPSVWIESVRKRIANETPNPNFDTVSNDWDYTNKSRELTIIPKRDSLCNSSRLSKMTTMKQIRDYQGETQTISKSLINSNFEEILTEIKYIFEANGTNYKIAISPAIWQLNSSINPEDLSILVSIFGEGNIFDFSGRNIITEDANNFTDSGHFGLRAGWIMIEKMFGELSTAE